MNSNSVMIRKLQTALNQRGQKILYTTNQFYSENQQRPVTIYLLKKAVFDPDKKKNFNVEIFKSTSQIQIVLFLRDLWYELNGMEIPKDNEVWNKVKENYLNGN